MWKRIKHSPIAHASLSKDDSQTAAWRRFCLSCISERMEKHPNGGDTLIVCLFVDSLLFPLSLWIDKPSAPVTLQSGVSPWQRSHSHRCCCQAASRRSRRPSCCRRRVSVYHETVCGVWRVDAKTPTNTTCALPQAGFNFLKGNLFPDFVCKSADTLNCFHRQQILQTKISWVF